MKPDLLFHVVSKRKWREFNNEGYYRITDDIENKPIECVDSVYLNNYLNEKFTGRKNLFILVIVTSRILNRVDVTGINGNNIYTVDDGINVDAILDKIRIDCNDQGLFELSVENR